MTDEQRGTVVMLSCDGLDRGGIGRWAAYLCEAMARLPDAPRMVVLDTRARSAKVIPSILVFAGVLARLVWMAATGRIGVLHLNVAERGSTARKFIAAEIGRAFGVSTVVHLHAGGFVDFYRAIPAWAQAAVRRMFLRASKVVVLGQVWEDAVMRELGVPRGLIVIEPNGVPRPPPAAAAPVRPDSPCQIVMLARLSPEKGVDELMAAFMEPRLRALEWRATLAGSAAEPYRRRADAAGLADRISFPGWVDGEAISRLLAQADILVLPSHFECMPVSVLEAMAHGVAVITTPVGAVPEFVVDGESGLLIPVRDAPALAAALETLIVDGPLRRRLASAGRAVFEQRLDMALSARRYAALYRSLLDTARRSTKAR